MGLENSFSAQHSTHGCDRLYPARDSSYSPTPKQSLLKTAAPVALICAFLNVFFYTLVVSMPSYLIYFLNYPHQWAYLTNTLTLAALVPVILFSGYAGQ